MIKIATYDRLPAMPTLPAGTYIFSDLERMNPIQRALATEVWNQLSAAGPNVRLLNHPAQALGRLELLHTLHDSGRNQFNVYPVSETHSPQRFPVFLRCATDHLGSLTKLLTTQEELDSAILAALLHGLRLDDLLIVEYCSAADADGVHHKFAAFCVAGQIIPRHLIFSRDWILKLPDLLDADKLAREREYFQTNPHEQTLREVFQAAHIDYGRCDYAVINGKIQIWEINTNPVVMLLPKQYQPDHLPVQKEFATRIRAAFEAINLPVDPGQQIPLRLDPAIITRLAQADACSSR
jgi:hypothetical protein